MSCHNFNYGFTIVNIKKFMFDICIKIFLKKRIHLSSNFLKMSKNLVIVESPAKAKTIEKFLGVDFKVVSSNGHIADLHQMSLV